MWELTKSFRFEAAHALSGTTYGAESEAIHGHSFRAEVTVRGMPARVFRAQWFVTQKSSPPQTTSGYADQVGVTGPAHHKFKAREISSLRTAATCSRRTPRARTNRRPCPCWPRHTDSRHSAAKPCSDGRC